MSASYLQFRARMLSINPLTDLAGLIGQIRLDMHLSRTRGARAHYEALAQESQSPS